ncbi:hypothetical protein EAX61_04050 [Dokdonia sinensis]|uniref:Uncharacterized protein n=1 Tax=Dokdonia sinensis TaxID=2479847 RepID=A0A3M0GE60_9FLAO|nr:hypothetical protein [Dokdonia sinensis]RMB62757.1 hypothetical protein EAX61_04050 [Dokdonia sinensis]
MAPIKLEDNMKERLEERRIAPTGAAWDRISSKLDNEKGKKKGTIVLWSAIAASFVGGALITLFVLSNDVSPNDSNFVEAPQEESTKSEEIVAPQIINDSKNVEVVQTNEVMQSSNESKEDISEPLNKSQKREAESAIVVNKSKSFKQISNPVLTDEKTNGGTVIVENSIDKPTQESPILKNSIDKKIKEIMTQVDVNAVTDTEVDALLKQARREIISASVFDQQSNKVDANALLLDVEADIDPETFKDKVFGILKEGFYTARDAVADRNN